MKLRRKRKGQLVEGKKEDRDERVEDGAGSGDGVRVAFAGLSCNRPHQQPESSAGESTEDADDEAEEDVAYERRKMSKDMRRRRREDEAHRRIGWSSSRS
jgi:hypothetical protein